MSRNPRNYSVELLPNGLLRIQCRASKSRACFDPRSGRPRVFGHELPLPASFVRQLAQLARKVR